MPLKSQKYCAEIETGPVRTLSPYFLILEKSRCMALISIWFEVTCLILISYFQRNFQQLTCCCCCYTVNNKKHIPLFFNISFFSYISGTAWATKNLLLFFCILFWSSLGWNKNFSHPVTKSADICKNVNLPIKNYLLGKISHFEKVKNFFPWI